MRLKNKVAIVTGAGSGMGRAITELFAAEGAAVVAADIKPESLQDVVSAVQAQGGTITPVVANVASEDDVKAMIAAAIATYGKLDILVNNAGVMDNFNPVTEVTDDLWERVMAINLTGPMRAMRHGIPLMIENQGGVIINVASIGGLQGARAGAAYSASKHGVMGLTKNTAFMYADQGIRCNAICPGGVETNIGTTITQPSPMGSKRMGLGFASNPRMGKPSEIAAVALFLASDDASFVNGATVVADAGWTAY